MHETRPQWFQELLETLQPLSDELAHLMKSIAEDAMEADGITENSFGAEEIKRIVADYDFCHRLDVLQEKSDYFASVLRKDRELQDSKKIKFSELLQHMDFLTDLDSAEKAILDSTQNCGTQTKAIGLEFFLHDITTFSDKLTQIPAFSYRFVTCINTISPKIMEDFPLTIEELAKTAPPTEGKEHLLAGIAQILAVIGLVCESCIENAQPEE